MKAKIIENSLESDLNKKYGPLIGGKDLVLTLGFKTAPAFRRAEKMGLLGVKVFSIAGRRGKFAYTKDVATWIATVME